MNNGASVPAFLKARLSRNRHPNSSALTGFQAVASFAVDMLMQTGLTQQASAKLVGEESRGLGVSIGHNGSRLERVIVGWRKELRKLKNVPDLDNAQDISRRDIGKHIYHEFLRDLKLDPSLPAEENRRYIIEVFRAMVRLIPTGE
jgi:hypothetical protein